MYHMKPPLFLRLNINDYKHGKPFNNNIAAPVSVSMEHMQFLIFCMLFSIIYMKPVVLHTHTHIQVSYYIYIYT